MAKINNLKDVYLHELKDLYSACSQSKTSTQTLHDHATDPELKKALEAGVKGIQDGMTTIEKILGGHNESAGGVVCKGMKGLVEEARHHVVEGEFGDMDAKDAVIIGQYQRMAHYAIAGYGCTEAFARRLKLESDADQLRHCKEETIEGDVRFTKIAVGEDGVNAKATS